MTSQPTTGPAPDTSDPDGPDGPDRRDESRRTGSRALHFIDRIAGRTTVAIGVVLADLVWVLYSVIFGFPARLEVIFQTLVAALTLAIVFVIQHTQTRQQVATQRKLDEILRAIPRADNAMIALEDADDRTLASTRSSHRTLRREALDVQA